MAEGTSQLVAPRRKIIDLFSAVGEDYVQKEAASFELHDLHDVHAFYRLSSDTSQVVHVQGYPGLVVKEDEARVWARLMDYHEMMDIRKTDTRISVGNEHEATIQSFPNFEGGVFIPYDPKVLEEMLAENVPSLR